MSDTNTNGGTVCSACGDPATTKQGHQHLCDKHYRFGQMRAKAKAGGKAVPSRHDLALMEGVDLVCPDCGVRMNWRARDGQETVASLQHYRDGSMAIVCLSCNSRHASMDGDSFRAMDASSKQCPCCGRIKPSTEFTADNSRSGSLKRKSKCRACADEATTKWKEKNREQYNAYQRAYRAKRKSEGRPVTRSD